ncbi:MAG: dsRBD fold-containing protein [Mycobacteriales bacterium]
MDWTVRISLDEDDDHTHARAVLTSRDGVRVTTVGDAHRNPRDAVVPEIGEELAAARALYALADRLMDVASTDVENLSHPV